jgi:hypothetical protein
MCRKVSYKNPLTPSFDKLVQKHPNVCQYKATDVETEELGGMAGAEFQTDLGFVCVPETRVLNLTCDLICYFSQYDGGREMGLD